MVSFSICYSEPTRIDRFILYSFWLDYPSDLWLSLPSQSSILFLLDFFSSFSPPSPSSLSLLFLYHQSIYKHIVDNYQVVYVAGGAAQNAARCAQYVLPANSTAYLGCVGDDDLANQLRAANDKEGLHSAYQVDKENATGSCAVVITGHDRWVSWIRKDG